ncbi:MAG: SUMF1/EgtB/PvdO family nonheme iron enzyme, partial [Polyangia bacterium]
MIWECRWLAIGLALSFTALACSRTPMDEQHGVTTNTISSGGGAGTVTSGGTTGTIGNTGGGVPTSFPGSAIGAGGTVASGGRTSAGGTTTAGGTTASGGSSGSGGTNGKGGTWGGTAPSCSGLAATCGPSGNDDCCRSLLVPGGTFYRSYDGVDYTDKSYPAAVDDFYLDKYEITVGRFRQFVNAGMGTQARPPASGAGANLAITGSGWDSTWNTNLAANTA